MRKNIDGPLAGATLTSTAASFDYNPTAMMPDVKVFKIGGQSILDRGRAAVFPVLDELVAAKDKYQLL
ncbi:MAG: uridine kinase, partial [bacterium]|nr:uridine kinase [bacterium]